MGVRGGALRLTALSQALSCIWVLTFLMGKKTQLRLRPNQFGLQKAIILPCVRHWGTCHLSLCRAAMGIISVCFNSSLLKYGRAYCRRRHDHSDQRNDVCYAASAGTGDKGAQPIISYNYVRQKTRERVKRVLLRLLLKKVSIRPTSQRSFCGR